MKASGAKAYLVNTGWNGTGKRISIKDTRGIIDAILDGSIKTAPTKKIPLLQLRGAHRAARRRLQDPRPRATPTPTPPSGETKAKDLASRFQKNFVKYEDNEAGKALVPAGPAAVS